MLSNLDAVTQLADIMNTQVFRKNNVYDRARMLDYHCEGLGKLYLHYMIQIGKPTDFILKATDLLVANSTKLGRILK